MHACREEREAANSRQAGRQAGLCLVAAGLRLIEVKTRCKGQDLSFTDWLADNFEFSRMTAYNLMKLAGAEPEEREAAKAKERDRKRVTVNRSASSLVVRDTQLFAHQLCRLFLLSTVALAASLPLLEVTPGVEAVQHHAKVIQTAA